jgi:hypothetical protein
MCSVQGQEGENIMPEMHLEKKTIHDVVIDPKHADRTESPEFRAAKERLKQDGHYKCWICGSTENVQIHHFVAEYMFTDIADLEKAKEVAEAFDIYGYGRLLRNQALLSTEDIRCLMALCREHHVSVDHEDGSGGTGIHDMTFPTWIIQRVAKDGFNPVPQKGETVEQVESRIEEQEANPNATS